MIFYILDIFPQYNMKVAETEKVVCRGAFSFSPDLFFYESTKETVMAWRHGSCTVYR
jgi:hypothetical protein